MISPGWASLEMTTPAKRRAHFQVVVVNLAHGDLALGHLDLRLRSFESRRQRVHVRARGIQRRITDQFLFDQLFVARQRVLRIRQSNFDFGEIAARSVELALGHRQHGLDVHRIEARQHLVLLHLHAFFDQDFLDLASDLGRHRGHAPRDDIAGCVEHRVAQTRARGIGFGRHRGDFGGLGTQPEPQALRPRRRAAATIAPIYKSRLPRPELRVGVERSMRREPSESESRAMRDKFLNLLPIILGVCESESRQG